MSQSHLQLNLDVLELIFDNICPSFYYWSTRTVYWKTYLKRELLAVSLTSKQFRAAVLPFLFREVVWDDDDSPISCMGKQARRYVKRFRLRDHSCSSPEAVAKALEDMPNLLHFIFDCDKLDATIIINKLCNVPSLVTLEFLQTPMTSFDDVLQYPRSLQRIVWKDAVLIRLDGWVGINSAASDLTDYVMIQNERHRAIATNPINPRERRIPSPSALQYGAPLPTPFSLALQSISHILQHLELGTSLFYQLSSESPLELPHIRTLILHGPGFRNDDNPLIPLLRGIPHLEDLQVLVHQYEGAYSGFHFLRSDSTYTMQNIAASHPSLRSVTLSDVSVFDTFLSAFPPSVRRISVVKHGEGDRKMGSIDNERLTYAILKAISRSKAAPTEIHVTMKRVPSVPTVQHIASLFPQLYTFTVTYPYLTYNSYEKRENDDKKKATDLALLQELDMPYLKSYYMAEFPDTQTYPGRIVSKRRRRGRLHLVFQMHPQGPHQARTFPFQCRHTLGPSGYSQQELQWDSCFHDMSQNSPVDLQVWWHAGDCVDKSSCLCQRSKYPGDHPSSSVVSLPLAETLSSANSV